MESLSETTWDVVLAGTGLPQSLLALALSRSGKKVLHVDKNDYYGGAEAALSLQEAESWVKNVNSELNPLLFENASIHSSKISPKSGHPQPDPRLGFSRAYSLSLSPQLIYTRSSLLPTLVSSKVYRQLEFLAVGSWWIYENTTSASDAGDDKATGTGDDASRGILKRIPGGRENVFADKTIDLKSKRSLMKFLKLAADEEGQSPLMEEWGSRSVSEFLTSYCKIPERLHPPLVALTLSPQPPDSTTTSYALPLIRRHLTSIGVFGPGFGSVVPKWGGTAEIAQVACRAGAVGGGVYILNKGVEGLDVPGVEHAEDGGFSTDTTAAPLTVHLQGGEEIKAKAVVGSRQDLPPSARAFAGLHHHTARAVSISIISSPLRKLFPVLTEEAPPPAAAVVCFPSGTLRTSPDSTAGNYPVYIIVQSSETGDCPTGQCVLYASIQLTGVAGADGYRVLDLAVQNLLGSLGDDTSTSELLWSLRYTQSAAIEDEKGGPSVGVGNGRVLQFSDPTLDLAFDDSVLEQVRDAWQKITGETEGFMMFEDRGESGEDDTEEM